MKLINKTEMPKTKKGKPAHPVWGELSIQLKTLPDDKAICVELPSNMLRKSFAQGVRRMLARDFPTVSHRSVGNTFYVFLKEPKP